MVTLKFGLEFDLYIIDTLNVISTITHILCSYYRQRTALLSIITEKMRNYLNWTTNVRFQAFVWDMHTQNLACAEHVQILFDFLTTI